MNLFLREKQFTEIKNFLLDTDLKIILYSIKIILLKTQTDY